MGAEVVTNKRAGQLALGLFLAVVALSAVAWWLIFLSRGVDIGERWGFRGFGTVMGLAFAVVGVPIARRLPRNPLGWIFCTAALIFVLTDATDAYGWYALVSRNGSLPGGAEIAWFGQWMWVLAMWLLLVVGLMVFPNGRFASPRWRQLAWGSGLLGAVVAVLLAVAPGPLTNSGVPALNPFGIEALGKNIEAITTVLLVPFMLSVLLGAASVISRFRTADPQQRLQLKWFAFGAVLATVMVAAGGALQFAGEVGEILIILGILNLPIFMGIAILRHRLFDIDLLINRALVYGALSAIVATGYAGGVVVLQRVFGPLTRDSDLAVAATTLAVAGAVGPLRRRIQEAIDHRFYRRKYDSILTVRSFGTRLRQGTELATLSDDLLEVVKKTVQPSHVSLWLPPAPPSAG